MHGCGFSTRPCGLGCSCLVLFGSSVETLPGCDRASDLPSLQTSRSRHFRLNEKTGGSDSVKWNRLVRALMGVKLAPKLLNESPFHSLQEPLLKSRGPCIDPVTKEVDGTSCCARAPRSPRRCARSRRATRRSILLNRLAHWLHR